MTNVSDLSDLISRLERASGPDRELDGAIAEAIGLSVPHDPAGWPPRYTSSLDAAVTLVPDGCQWTIEPDAAWVRWMGRSDVEEAQGHLMGRDGKCTAIALCIAALRAVAANRAACAPALTGSRF